MTATLIRQGRIVTAVDDYVADLLLDRGRVVAEGTHQELMVASAVYREIYDSQLGGGLTETDATQHVTSEGTA